MTTTTPHDRNDRADRRPEPRDGARIPDDQPAPNVRPRDTHQTSEVPLGSGDRPEAPGSGGDSARTTHRIPAVRDRGDSGSNSNSDR